MYKNKIYNNHASIAFNRDVIPLLLDVLKY